MRLELQESPDGSSPRARMLPQVHDELVFKVLEDALEETAAVVRRTMAEATLPALELSVPVVVDTGFGATWEEAH